jgi:hypothetical protein
VDGGLVLSAVTKLVRGILSLGLLKNPVEYASFKNYSGDDDECGMKHLNW